MKQVCLLFFLFFQAFTSFYGQHELKWNYFHPIKKTWFPYQTHGSIQEKLIESKELPSPFFKLNEEKFNWIENHNWELVSEPIFGGFNESKVIDIQFPAVDTYAKIYWNDSLVLITENAFRPFQIQVVLMSNTKNILKAVFTPPILYHEKRFKDEKFHYPAPNDPSSVPVSNLTRKPQYQFGWDWVARMNTIGFLEPVNWQVQRTNKLEDFHIQTTFLSEDSALVKYHFHFNTLDQEIDIKSSLFGTLKLKSNDTVARWVNRLNQPILWFPNGQGESFLYKDTLQIFSKKGILLESKPIQFGIRKTELVQEKDEWGTSYYLKINNKAVFCKGANLIPPSVFPGQITDAVWEEQIQLMKEQHFNMVRIWGGGLYPSDYFLKRCDEEGIMVWQDFMFACALYPADSLFLANVREELNYQIPRIAEHPAVVLFNGNNEVDVAWKNWGLQKQYHLTQSDSIQIASDYRLLFQDKIPTWVSSFTDIPYVHTSPLSNWGAPERYNHGSQHYWGVWHGTDPISDFSKNIGRFNAEFGYQSFPEYSTLNEIALETSWNLDSLAIKKHQKSYVGNGKILAEIKKSFAQPNDFMEFVYYSQLIQADAMEQAISAHRLNAPRCMGSIYWQLNDCYPGPTWSSVDYLGNRKILHYRMKEIMQPVTVVREDDKNGFNFLITSDLPQIQKVRYKITGIIKMNNKWIRDEMKTDSIQLNSLESQSIFGESALNRYFIANAVHALEVSWQVDAQTYSRIFWIKNQPPHKADNRDVKLKISKMDRKNKSLVLKLKAKQPIQHFWMYSTQKGIRYSENDFTLLPGKKEITIHFETVPKSRDFKWFGLKVGE